ncbi:unnamed protein product [Phytophthora fragariaefolia]|uniref:Unnamed protein product n=1 Tax=Phytophthora fragariaefolia TaxID=1490495 RepID=A0A9W7DBB9_9STRA|nr:unnamed protein product [Phytophthora fragariaefolia]
MSSSTLSSFSSSSTGGSTFKSFAFIDVSITVERNLSVGKTLGVDDLDAKQERNSGNTPSRMYSATTKVPNWLSKRNMMEKAPSTALRSTCGSTPSRGVELTSMIFLLIWYWNFSLFEESSIPSEFVVAQSQMWERYNRCLTSGRNAKFCAFSIHAVRNSFPVRMSAFRFESGKSTDDDRRSHTGTSAFGVPRSIRNHERLFAASTCENKS